MTDAHDSYNLDDDEPSAFVTKPRESWTDLDYAEALEEQVITLADIPDEFRTSQVYQVAVTLDKSVYGTIPEDRRDTQIRLNAIRRFPRLYAEEHDLTWMACPDYYMLACAAVASDQENIYYVNVGHIDRKMLSEAITTQPHVVWHLEQRYPDLMKEIVDQAFVEEAVVDNLRCLVLPKNYTGSNYLAEFPLPDEVLVKAIKAQAKKAGLLADLGREGLLTEMIKAGYWPEHWQGVAKPNDLEAGIKAFIENKHSQLQRTYYKAYINQWPSSEVIPLMLKWPRKNHLPDLFPKEELFDVFKDDLQILGKWFGEDLGL